MKKLARVRYNQPDDMFVIELYDNETETWDFSMGYKCMACDKEPNGEKNFIYYGIINEIFKLMDLGYEVIRGKD